MIRALVAIEADLPSSIAIRYACRLAELTKVEIRPIHVHEPAAAGPGMGTGWARHTWEKELLKDAQREISQLLIAESGYCPILLDPIIVSGNRESEVLSALRKGGYDLFIEGVPSDLTDKAFTKKMKGRFYQNVPIPTLVVRNLLPPNPVLLAVENEKTLEDCLGLISGFFERGDREADVLFFDSNGMGTRDLEAGMVKKTVEDYGWRLGRTCHSRDRTEGCVPGMEDCGLIATLVTRPFRAKPDVMEFLSHAPCPVLFFWA